ncbi:hypothetical protein F5146DRAFT_308495 [Armillaria mellea]|nr:hypothetical protein F5146DRAFT_308495 [Armillaria mellea]
MDDTEFDAAADLLNLMSQMVNLKVLYITNLEIRGNTTENPTSSILHDHVDAVPKWLRSLKLEESARSLYIFSWLSGGVFDLSDLTDLALSWRYFIYRPSPPLSCYIVPSISIVGSRIKHLRLNIETMEDDWYVNRFLEHFISTRALSSFTALETLNIDLNWFIQKDARHIVDIEPLLHHLTLPWLRKVCASP